MGKVVQIKNETIDVLRFSKDDLLESTFEIYLNEDDNQIFNSYLQYFAVEHYDESGEPILKHPIANLLITNEELEYGELGCIETVDEDEREAILHFDREQQHYFNQLLNDIQQMGSDAGFVDLQISSVQDEDGQTIINRVSFKISEVDTELDPEVDID